MCVYRRAIVRRSGLAVMKIWVEVVGHEVAQGYRPTAMLRDGAGTAVPRLLVQACGVEICCWAVVPRRAAVYSAAARAASAADIGRAELVFEAVCARARL